MASNSRIFCDNGADSGAYHSRRVGATCLWARGSFRVTFCVATFDGLVRKSPKSA